MEGYVREQNVRLNTYSIDCIYFCIYIRIICIDPRAEFVQFSEGGPWYTLWKPHLINRLEAVIS